MLKMIQPLFNLASACSCCKCTMVKKNHRSSSRLHCPIPMEQELHGIKKYLHVYMYNVCMLTGMRAFFKKLRTGGRPKIVQHTGGHYSQYVNHLMKASHHVLSCNAPGMKPPPVSDTNNLSVWIISGVHCALRFLTSLWS